jgi:hypothetical protein
VDQQFTAPGARQELFIRLAEALSSDAWQNLMTGVQWEAASPIDYNADDVRALSRKLLTEMERT